MTTCSAPRPAERCGGTALDVVDEVVEEKLHVVKEHQRRRVVRRVTCRCRAVSRARRPVRCPRRTLARRSRAIGWLGSSTRSSGCSRRWHRIRRDLAERGVPLAMGTLVNFVERAADLLAPIDGLHWKSLLAGQWMATDGTGLKVLVPGLADAPCSRIAHGSAPADDAGRALGRGRGLVGPLRRHADGDGTAPSTRSRTRCPST
ncbi:MAG UNVERIFIED_CONTAM: transposase [Anaerolineae bacterium]|jgi:hypothetical protein